MSYRAFRKEFLERQPRWSRRLFWFVGLPAWLVLGLAILASADGEGLPFWGWTAAVVFGSVAVVEWYQYGFGPRLP